MTKFNGHEITESSNCKDLGIVFTNSLTWLEHYEFISCKAYRSLGLLRGVFIDSRIHRRTGLKINVHHPN